MTAITYVVIFNEAIVNRAWTDIWKKWNVLAYVKLKKDTSDVILILSLVDKNFSKSKWNILIWQISSFK